MGYDLLIDSMKVKCMDIKFKFMLFKEKYLTNDRIKKVISNPMILLVVGAIISSLIIPYYTRQWQDRQKELELKTTLADEINKAISDVTVSATFRGTPGLFETNKNWLISKTMIDSKIKAYFSNHRITQDWENLSDVVSQLPGLAGGLPQKNNTAYNNYFCSLLGNLLKIYVSYPQSGPMNIDRSEISLHQCDTLYYPGLENIQYIKKYFPVKNDNIDWDALLRVDNNTNTSLKNYNKSYGILEKHIQDHTNKFLDTVFKSPITVFQ